MFERYSKTGQLRLIPRYDDEISKLCARVCSCSKCCVRDPCFIRWFQACMHHSNAWLSAYMRLSMPMKSMWLSVDLKVVKAALSEAASF